MTLVIKLNYEQGQVRFNEMRNALSVIEEIDLIQSVVQCGVFLLWIPASF